MSFKVGRWPDAENSQVRRDNIETRATDVLKFWVATFFFEINITSQGRLGTAGTSLIRDPHLTMVNYKPNQKRIDELPKVPRHKLRQTSEHSTFSSVFRLETHLLLTSIQPCENKTNNKKTRQIQSTKLTFTILSRSHTVGTKRCVLTHITWLYCTQEAHSSERSLSTTHWKKMRAAQSCASFSEHSEINILITINKTVHWSRFYAFTYGEKKRVSVHTLPPVSRRRLVSQVQANV